MVVGRRMREELSQKLSRKSESDSCTSSPYAASHQLLFSQRPQRPVRRFASLSEANPSLHRCRVRQVQDSAAV